jgi:glyoxylase-like metal-dependent hydrolase (beta-lactamase superfamily II)
MIQKTIRFAALCSLAALGVLQAQPPAREGQGRGGRGGGPPQPNQTIQMIKPGFYVVSGDGGNTGVRVTKQGLIVVDTKNLGDPFYNALMAQIKTVSDQPVKYVVVTHHHQDHSGNIQKFVDAGAQVVAHEGLKTNLATYNPPQGKPGLPNVTYAKNYKIKLGGAKVQVYHFGRAHTGGDSIVYYPDLKIVQTGDVVVGIVPNYDSPFGGSVVEASQVLGDILKLNFDTCIPGHSAQGKLTMTKDDVRAFKMKLDTIIARGRELVKMGTPKDQLIAKIKTDDLGWNINNQQWNNPQRLDAFYAELSK